MGALADTALAHEFPVLDREGLVYLDSSATSQTPRAVIEAMDDYYESHRASVHRGVYPLAAEATDAAKLYGLLRRMIGDGNIVVGTPVRVRSSSDIEQVMGL